MRLKGWQRLWLFTSFVLGCLAVWLTVKTYPDDAWVYAQFENHEARVSIVSLEMERYTKNPYEGNGVADTQPITQADVDARIAEQAAARDELLAAFPGLRRAHVIRSTAKWLALSAGLNHPRYFGHP